jgi:exonuclease VII small subunit
MIIRIVAKVLIIFLIFFLLSGCSDIEPNELKKLKEKVTDLENQLFNLEEKYNQFEHWLKQIQHSSIILDPTQKVYQRIDTYAGPFYIVLDDVTPFPGGYKLKLRIGTPLCANFSGFKLFIRWGKGQKSEKYVKWIKSLKYKEISYAEQLFAGRYTKVTLVLSPATIEEIEYMELSMETEAVSLRSR